MPFRRLACSVAALACLGLTALRSGAAPAHSLPENLATEAAAKGETASATESLTGMLTLALAQDPTLALIRDAGHWNHNQIASAVEARLNLTRAGVGTLREVTGDLANEARERVSAALTAIDDAQTRLQFEIRSARNVDEAGWTAARDALGAAFILYARTVLTAATTADAALTQAPAGS